MMQAQANTTWGTWGTARRRRCSKINRLEALQRQSSKKRLLSILGLNRPERGQLLADDAATSSCQGLPKSSSSPSMEFGSGIPRRIPPKRNSSLRFLLAKMPSLTPDNSREVVLPERTLLSGKGSERSLIRQASERSLVKKISHSIHSGHGSVSCTEESMSLSFQQGSAASFTTFQDSMDSIPFDWNEQDNGGWKTHEENLMSNANRVPPLHRKELVVGELLGTGAFSKVMALQGIKLMDREEFQKRKQQLNYQDPPTEEMAHAITMPEMRQQLAKEYPASANIPLEIVQQESSSKSLVIKHLDRKLLRKPKQFQQAALDLAREAQILAATDCKYIIKLRAISLGGTTALDSGRFNDLFLVLDRLEDTLDARIAQWKVDQDASIGIWQHGKAGFYYRATHYALELASALEYLHERRIVFRDTKPGNVGFLLLGPETTELDSPQNERVQLFDFGLCRPLPKDQSADSEEDGSMEDGSIHLDLDKDATFHMSMAGTLRYMSPEMHLEEAYNCKSDVYSWAITFAHMLSLRKPYGEILHSGQFLGFICELGKRPFLGDLALPASLQRVLQEAWCASIADRLSMWQVRERLEAILVESFS